MEGQKLTAFREHPMSTAPRAWLEPCSGIAEEKVALVPQTERHEEAASWFRFSGCLRSEANESETAGAGSRVIEVVVATGS